MICVQLHFRMPAGGLEQALAEVVACQGAVFWGSFAYLYMNQSAEVLASSLHCLHHAAGLSVTQ